MPQLFLFPCFLVLAVVVISINVDSGVVLECLLMVVAVLHFVFSSSSLRLLLGMDLLVFVLPFGFSTFLDECLPLIHCGHLFSLGNILTRQIIVSSRN